MVLLNAVLNAVSWVVGQVLRAATGAIGARPTAKPLHPRGRVEVGTLHRTGGDGEAPSAWLDEARDDRVLVRHSRAVGLPAPMPDIFGLAIRIPLGSDRQGDLLFATTGLGRLTRYTLTVARSPYGRPMTTLLPYRTPSGPVLLSATYRDEQTVELAWAFATGTWHRFAELRLDGEHRQGSSVGPSFDPVRNPLPDLESYYWVRRMREPAYVTARRARRS